MNVEELKNDANFWPAFPDDVKRFAIKDGGTFPAYVSQIYILGDDVVVRTWAYRTRKTNNYNLEITEVERKTLDMQVSRNIYYTPIGGYRPVFSPKSGGSKNWYGYTYSYFAPEDFNVWGYENKAMGITSHLLNPEKIFEVDKYEHCGYSRQQDLLEYIRLYEKYPEVEYFGKLGLKASTALINKCKKDHQFIRFLRDNVEDANRYGTQATIFAYGNKIDIKTAYYALAIKRRAEKETAFVKGSGTKVDRVRLYNYIVDNEIGFYNYRDYWNAMRNIGLDLNDTKNIFPRDFKRMHDLRIEQYRAMQAKADKEERKKLNKRIAEAAELFAAYAIQRGEYSVIFPHTTRDFKREGNELDHCVGKMGYEKKMADGKCLIAFIRKSAEIDKPYVTVEYLLDSKKVSQIYGIHDSRPEQPVIDFVNDWARTLTKELKQKEKKYAEG